MASQGPRTAGTCVDDATVGAIAWSTVTNAQGAQDNVYASATAAPSGNGLDNSVKLVQNGTISGTDQSAAAIMPTTGADPPASATWRSFGGQTNTWGLPLSVSDVNASTFGLAYACIRSGAASGTHYIKATNFGFSVPTESRIVGVVGEVCEDFESVNAGSFAAGTMVQTPSGLRPIELIRKDDWVYAFTAKKRLVVRKVLSTRNRVSREGTILIRSGHQSIETTSEHLFLTSQGWRRADRLKIKDRLYSFGAPDQMGLSGITSIETRPGATPVYNFEVSGSHTYFANNFAVHNAAAGNIFLYVDAIRITVYYYPSAQYTGMMQFFKRIH